ncbi:uncharacterized protein E0L32_008811 [Thyridium curvatum]|uniref:Mitochondrial escape protein 2 n=1 Tax=Thyridium curvatum TaxID=1093900 RepID=A0A507ATZ4_9PEZI|nr:uncharacterized protein E0L32_008811 [Thyridium curvatum]TPX09964.1 hypothetical protein E0L32_008811 [Thyridium curvatum]
MIPQRPLFRPALRRELLRCHTATRPPFFAPALLAAYARVQNRLPVSPRRWETTGDEKTGHIKAAADESILFFDNLFPLKLSSFLSRPWRTDQDLTELLRRFESSTLGMMNPINMVKRAIPGDLPIKVTEIVPRLKDGGAFVKFNHPADVTAAEIESNLSQRLREKPLKPWFSPFRGVQAGLVNGVPWLEDLYRFPKSRVKVEFVPSEPGNDAVELSQEGLYSMFRKYGMIGEIISQPFDSKAVPRYAYLDFVLVRDAIMARNCMHGFVVPESLGGGKNGTKLRLSYEQRVKPHHIWEWLTSHPRIVIPIIAALLATVTVAIFDPIREFFIKAHVQHSFRLNNYRVYRWFKKQTSDILAFARRKGEAAGLNALWTHRKDIIDSVQAWLLETTDTFIVVQGPRGSGKKELIVDQALKGRHNVLVIDCKPIVEARGESGTIKNLAQAVGYRPIFSWANNLSSMIDLAVQSTTGVKAGFSETLESQISKILQTTAVALTDLALSSRKKDDKDAGMSGDAYLEAHPERRPVIVIDNFLHKNEETSLVYDKITDWAATLVTNNIAHVIFLTNDSSYSKSLSKSLPDRVFRQVALGDLSPAVAKKYVLSHLDGLDKEELAKAQAEGDEAEEEGAAEKQLPLRTPEQRRSDLRELDDCIDTLGGRLTDLEFLARRLKTGQTPKRAVAEIVEQSSSEIIKMFLLIGNRSAGGSGADRKWSPEQAWYLIKELADKESLRYNEVLLSNTFASSTTAAAADGELALESLANAELISIRSHRGRPMTIGAGKPVYQAAFGQLRGDAVLRARMELALLAELAKVEAKTIDKAEAELALLGALPRQPAQAAERVGYLLAKLQGSQAKIAAYELEMAGMKEILTKEA